MLTKSNVIISAVRSLKFLMRKSFKSYISSRSYYFLVGIRKVTCEKSESIYIHLHVYLQLYIYIYLYLDIYVYIRDTLVIRTDQKNVNIKFKDLVANRVPLPNYYKQLIYICLLSK